MRHTLVNATRRQNIHILTRMLGRIRLRQPATNLNQKRAAGLPILRPIILQLLRRRPHAISRKVIKHDNIRSRADRRMSLFDAPTFNFDFGRETTCCLRGLNSGGDSLGDGSIRCVTFILVVAGPDVVILEHGHGAEVVAVRVCAADEDAVFLDEAETGGCFAGSGEDAVPAVGAEDGEEGGGSGCVLENQELFER